MSTEQQPTQVSLHTARRRRRRRRSSLRGVAAAEFAVCLPIIVLLVIATIEACSAIFLKQSLTVAAYEGARTALVDGNTATRVTAACNRILKDRKIDGATIKITPSDVAAMQPGQIIDVQVSAPCAKNSVVPASFYRGKTLSATASMMIEN